MTSTAISAQGSTLEIGTGSGGAKTITAVAVGNPTILTIAAHGLNNGDVVTLAALTGADAATLNSKQVSVLYKTTNTIAVAIDTTGKTITAGSGTASPVTWTGIGNWKDWTGFDGSASELDKTNLSSTAKEFMLGLADNGQLTINVDWDNTDAGQVALRAKRVSGAISNFRMTLPDASVLTFAGYVKKFGVGGGVDSLVKTPCDIRISGAVTGL